MTVPHYEIREFGRRALTSKEADDVTQLHCELLGHSPLVLMGPEFMRDFYYTVLPADGLVCGAIAYVQGKAAGFVVATDDPNGFMSRAFSDHWLRIVYLMIKSVIRNPSRVLAMKEAYEIQKNVQNGECAKGVGELLSFGVLKEYRTRSFMSESGIHIASDLHERAVGRLKRMNSRVIRAIVDKDNLEAQFFYRAHGWHVGLKTVKGWRVPTMEFLLNVELSPSNCS